VTEGEAQIQAQTLRRAVSRFQRALRSTRDPESPTPAQLSALGTLSREGAMASGELARRERLKPQSVTRLIAALVEGGLAARIVDSSDRRRLLVSITTHGRQELAREMRRRDRQLARRLLKLSVAERTTLAAASLLLERFASGENAS
jgi:DNA-binding MarR family transcriptional regulator